MKVLSIVVVTTMVLAVTDAQFSLSNIFSGLRPLFGRPRGRARPRQRPQTIFVPAGQFFTENEQSNFIPQASPSTSFLPVGPEVFQSGPRVPPTSEPRPPSPITRPPPPPPISRPLPPPAISRPPPPPPASISRPPPPPRTVEPSSRPSSPRPTQQVPTQPQVIIPSPHLAPSRLNNNGREFGDPKPESVVGKSVHLLQTSPPVQIFSDDNRLDEPNLQVSSSQREESSNFKVTHANQEILVESFPNPLPRQNDNNIIGMLPPPLPSSTTTSSTSTTTTSTTTGAVIVRLPSSTTTTTRAGPVLVTQPPLFSISSSLAPLTPITHLNTLLNPQSRENLPQPDGIVTSGPETNSVDTVAVNQNPVPHVNAGVLPLADLSKEPQFFPPFNQISVETFNSEREQRDLFPPFGFKEDQ